MANPKHEKKEDETMLTITEAAETANLTESAIYNAILRNRLPAHELYGRKLVKPSELETYLATKPKGRPKGAKNKPKQTGEGGEPNTETQH